MPSEHSKIMTNKCVDCHYYTGKAKADNTPSEKGGHTFSINDKVCLQCHEEPTKLVEKWKPIIEPLAKQLKELLDNYPDKRSRLYLDVRKNYGMVMGDNGMGIYGIHNPQYAEILLKYSISALTSGSSWKEQK